MKSYPKKDLVRIVKTDEGFSLDATGRMPGRGAYICRNKACLEAAIKRNIVGRSLKTYCTREECACLIPQLEEILQQTSTREVF